MDDLLSAALNESGLINFDQTDGRQTQDNKPTTFTMAVSKSTSIPSSHISSPIKVVKSLSTNSSAVTNNKVVKVLGGGAKIIKLPVLKAGSVIKINKDGKVVNSPASLSPLITKNQTIKKETPAVVAPIEVKKEAPSANMILRDPTKFQKVTRGGKTIFIPVASNKTALPAPTVVRTPIFCGVQTNRTALRPANINTLKVARIQPPAKNLNLGSLFVQSAVDDVTANHQIPNSSRSIFVQSNTSSRCYNTRAARGVHMSNKKYSSKDYLKSWKDDDGDSESSSSSNGGGSYRGSSRSSSASASPVHSEHSLSDNLKLHMSNIQRKLKGGEEIVADEDEEENTQNVRTYSEYTPAKLCIGTAHPDSVVETSSLASIPPPDVTYDLNLPHQIIETGKLSALQLESVVYSCQKHNIILPSGERAGFLIGDGAGVGKGRTVAGIIYENYLCGRKKALWFSVSNDLKYDAERDLKDIGAKHLKVYHLNKFKYGKITSKANGAVKKGVIFSTYSSLIGESHSKGKYSTRLQQIVHWCGEDFDGVIIFDECHKAKNLIPSGSGKTTKTATTVLQLQNLLPNARVIYASATGASEPRNMAYMSRIGLWGRGTPFNDFHDFIQAVERRGIGAMELVAMDMKLRGSYIARQLSFYGVSFRVEEVQLNEAFIQMYNKSVKLWVMAREAFQIAATFIDAEYHMKKSMWAQFWSAHQRFFKYLCISAKVNSTVTLVREAVKHGKCVVIGIQSTGEASTQDQLEKDGGNIEDFVSTAKAVFENLIHNHFPAPDRDLVTRLFGSDFYKNCQPTMNYEQLQQQENNKRKRMSNGTEVPDAKQRKRSDESVDTHVTNDTSCNDDDSDHYSDDDVDDEDINKIFGEESEEEESDNDDNERTLNDDVKPVELPPAQKTALELEADKLKPIYQKVDKQSHELLKNLDLISGTLTSALPGMGPVERAQALKQELLERLNILGTCLPNNMLDELVDALGGPENVAEMTGRKGRIISTVEGNIRYESRAENDVPTELLNLTEKQRFMDGEKNVAIISEAASSGISLQSDRRVRNQRRRVHVTLELPWSADRAIQQFGRTHRSNQVSAPEYVFMISELAGEQRFASVIAKRLESLGALTHGDRRATESRDFSQYNYDNKYGRKALDIIMKAIAGMEVAYVPPPKEYKGDFFKDMRQALLGVGLITRETGQTTYQLDKDYHNIFKFMNRMLGMEVEHQNGLFAFFLETLNAIMQEAKSTGQYDLGILDIGTETNPVEHVDDEEFPIPSCGHVTLHTLKLERGCSWEQANKLKEKETNQQDTGFYLTTQKYNNKRVAILVLEVKTRRRFGPSLYQVYRPNTGKQWRNETLEDIERKYYKCNDDEDAMKWWNAQYTAAESQCSHQYWQGACTRSSCSIGKRCRKYHVLCGSVLSVWKIVESSLNEEGPGGEKRKMQIVRLKTSDDNKLVGLLIPLLCVGTLRRALQSGDLQQVTVEPKVSNKVFDPSTYVVSDDGSESEEEYEEVAEDPDQLVSSVLAPKLAWNA